MSKPKKNQSHSQIQKKKTLEISALTRNAKSTGHWLGLLHHYVAIECSEETANNAEELNGHFVPGLLQFEVTLYREER